MDKELPISPWPEWKIVSKIGEGSFGRVYKAQRTEKGRQGASQDPPLWSIQALSHSVSCL